MTKLNDYSAQLAEKVELNKEECNKNINFVSGLSGSMEINIGKRSVMDYFLEPILGNLNDSLKEK